MSKFEVVSRTTGDLLGYVWAGCRTAALALAFRRWPNRRVAIIG